jgi:type IV secretion system protein VirB1
MDFSALLHQCTPANVSVDTMHRIVSVESARTPHAIGYKLIRVVKVIEGGKETMRKEVSTLKTQPRSVPEAVQWVKYLLAEGYEFDAGPSQIHSTNFAHYKLTPESVFDACTNIRVGGEILTDCYSRALGVFKAPAASLQAALSCYQSGNFSTGFSTGYVARVVGSAGPAQATLPAPQPR